MKKQATIDELDTDQIANRLLAVCILKALTCWNNRYPLPPHPIEKTQKLLLTLGDELITRLLKEVPLPEPAIQPTVKKPHRPRKRPSP